MQKGSYQSIVHEPTCKQSFTGRSYRSFRWIKLAESYQVTGCKINYKFVSFQRESLEVQVFINGLF